LRSTEQPHFPPELMGEPGGSRLSAVLGEAERVSEFDWSPVPVGALEDLEGIRWPIVARPPTVRFSRAAPGSSALEKAGPELASNARPTSSDHVRTPTGRR
jgi:hypothetical protein